MSLSSIDIEYITIGIFALLILSIFILSYRRIAAEHKPFIFALSGIFITLMAIFLLPAEFQLYLMGIIISFVIYLIGYIISQHYFSSVEKVLLIDKKKSVWETFENPPELKPESITKM